MEQKAYRTLLLRYPLEKLPPEGQARIAQLLKMQQEFRQWAEEWVKNKGNTPAPAENTLKYFAEKFLLATKALEWPRSHTVRHGFKPPPVFNAWLRLNGERREQRRLRRFAEERS